MEPLSNTVVLYQLALPELFLLALEGNQQPHHGSANRTRPKETEAETWKPGRLIGMMTMTGTCLRWPFPFQADKKAIESHI